MPAPYSGAAARWRRALQAVLWREALRFLHQRERFFSALVRPLIWLLVFANGMRAALGLSPRPPYLTYITYDTYIVPGLTAMILLFAGLQASLAMVYDREMGAMRVLLTAPLPRWFMLLAKLLAGTLVGVAQAYAFLLIAGLYGIRGTAEGYLLLFPLLLLCGLMLGALGMVLASTIRQLENFAGVMNFVIFPLFFMSSALYPLWRVQDSSWTLWWLCRLNPFTDGVELIRFGFYGQVELRALAWVAGVTVVLCLSALWAYRPRGGRGPAAG